MGCGCVLAIPAARTMRLTCRHPATSLNPVKKLGDCPKLPYDGLKVLRTVPCRRPLCVAPRLGRSSHRRSGTLASMSADRSLSSESHVRFIEVVEPEGRRLVASEVKSSLTSVATYWPPAVRRLTFIPPLSLIAMSVVESF